MPFLPAPSTSRRALAATTLAGVGLAATAVAGPVTAATSTVTLFQSTKPSAFSTRSSSIELGVRFSSDVPGTVTGVRFYKGAGNTGTHYGSLWSTSGQRLAKVRFTGETRDGWQTARFAHPVAVAAHTTYVASYLAPRGHYARVLGYFAASHRSGPLYAGTRGNGSYAYGSGFPRLTSTRTNYYVDVLFTPRSAPSSAPAAAYGWQLTAARTGLAGAGVARTSLPVWNGSVRAGMTLSRVRITRPLDLRGTPNVTLDRVWLAPTSGRQALVLGSGTVIKDSDIDGSAMPVAERDGIYGNSPGAYTIARVNITGMTVGAWLDGDGGGAGTMTDTYIHDMVSNGGQHMDGFTRRAGTAPLTILRSRVDDTGASVTGAFFLQNTWGGAIAGITVKDTSLEGDGYVLTLENKGAGTAVGFNNVRIRSTGWGPITATPFSGNGPGRITYTSWSAVSTATASGATRALSHP